MHTAEEVTLARLPSGVPLTTTVHTYGEGEPIVYAQAAQHGREVNGVEVLRRLHAELVDHGTGTDAPSLGGTLVAVPVANPLTFDRVSYTAPEVLDSVNGNMNRCWPGDPEGTLHERMAARLWEYASDADAIVDLHTGSPEMLTHTVYLGGDEDSRALAEAFGTDVLLAEAAGDDADTEWAERDFDGKLRVAATREGIPTITPELAYSKTIDEAAVETGVQGMLDILREVGVLPGDVSEWSGTVARNHLGRVRADASGLFRPDPALELGEDVSEGATLGAVHDPATYERLQTVTADRDGIVYSITREATVPVGTTLVGVADVLERCQ